MNRMLAAGLALVLMGQAPKPTTAERLSEDVKTWIAQSQAPARQAVQELAELATSDNFKSLGFNSLDEVKKAELGKPLPVVIVKLDELRDYKEGDDAYKLLHPIPKVMYAVNVQGETRSGVEVEKQDGQWHASSFGATPLARRHAEALKKQAAKDRAETFFIIKVLALNRMYLAYQNDKGAWLIPVQWDDEDAKVEPRLAASVLSELVKDANEHDGRFR